MIGETIVTAPRISTDIEVEPIQIDTSFQDISSELAELEKQVQELQQRKQSLIGQSQQGLGRFAPQEMFSFTDPNFQGGKQMFVKDFDNLINPLLERIQTLKELQTTKIDQAGISPAPIKVDPDPIQTQIDEINSGIADPEVPTTLTTEIPDAGDTTNEEDQEDTESSVSEFFGGRNFKTFLRNVGQALTETGQMGEGLAVGSAAAAREIAARELAKEKELAELAKEALEKSLEGIKPADAEKLGTAEKNINTNIKKFNDTQQKIRSVDEAIYYLKNDTRFGGGIGFLGLLGKFKDDLYAIAGIGRNDDTGFEGLETRTKVDAILRVLQQQGVREILGEEGSRAISNLDRTLVGEIFGTLTTRTTFAEIIKKLEDSRARFQRSQELNRDNVISDVNLITNINIPSGILGTVKQPGTQRQQIGSIIDYLPSTDSTFTPNIDQNIAGEADIFENPEDLKRKALESSGINTNTPNPYP